MGSARRVAASERQVQQSPGRVRLLQHDPTVLEVRKLVDQDLCHGGIGFGVSNGSLRCLTEQSKSTYGARIILIYAHLSIESLPPMPDPISGPAQRGSSHPRASHGRSSTHAAPASEDWVLETAWLNNEGATMCEMRCLFRNLFQAPRIS